MKNFFFFLALVVISGLIVFNSESCTKFDSTAQNGDLKKDISSNLQIQGRDSEQIPVLTSCQTISLESEALLEDFTESSGYIDFLNDYSFSATEYYKLVADNSFTFFAIQLEKEIDLSGKEYYLVLYPRGNNDVKPVLFEQKIEGNYAIISLYEMEGYSPISSGNFYLGGGVVPPADINCDDTTNNFNDCMNCAFEVLTSDWVFTVSCTFFPVSCVSAAVIHCL